MDASALEQIRQADLRARSAEIVVDGQSLLISHVHIHSVEPILDVRLESGHGRAIGIVELGDTQWPVFCISGDLDILDSMPAARRACVLLKSDHGGVAFVCDEVRVVDNTDLSLVPVPGCMRGGHDLMESLAVIDDKVTCVLSADGLSGMLTAQSQAHGGAYAGSVEGQG